MCGWEDWDRYEIPRTPSPLPPPLPLLPLSLDERLRCVEDTQMAILDRLQTIESLLQQPTNNFRHWYTPPTALQLLASRAEPQPAFVLLVSQVHRYGTQPASILLASQVQRYKPQPASILLASQVRRYEPQPASILLARRYEPQPASVLLVSRVQRYGPQPASILLASRVQRLWHPRLYLIGISN